ncbi:OmpA family protein [Cyanobacterium aponinum FACHB-4101]|uniref:OmpA/MotB family protein n=1 Tax=Cyanobacterium aponinum TaxID=379064 RepID=UPI0016804805|nr:OmpA family protein [Cyanobacterium aponinum]MBD2393464.1 OmpA family protein [Cyanobacterium aponinum FACHB-4101]
MSNFLEYETEEEFIEEQDSGVWLSVGDLMSGLLMFFALLFIAVSAQLVRYEEVIKTLPERIINAIENKIGDKGNLTRDEKTGDITLPNEILFDEGSYQLKPQGKNFLKEFIPAFSDAIFSDELIANQVSLIIIEGHTSSKGEEKDNMELSFKRALAVTEYIKSIKFSNKDKFKQKLLAAGRGEIDSNQEFDSPNDRKVMFRFQFKRGELGEIFNQKVNNYSENNSK